MISIVFPAYNEEENIKELHRLIKEAMNSVGETYEIIGVDNGSTDGTLKALKSCSPIRIIVFAKNMGQTLALDAGIQAARGDIIVTLDADLQNDPRDIPLMIQKMKEGYDVVVGWRKDRYDNFGRRLLSRLANWLTRRVTGLYLHDYACALKAFKKELMEGINLYGEMHVFLSAIFFIRGAKIAEMVIKHHQRAAGVSKHYFMKAVKDIADLLAVKFMFTYSTRPFLFFGGWGLFSVFLGIIAGVWSVVLKVLDLRNFAQTPLPVVATLFIILGFLLGMMGFLGEFMLRIYYETTKRTPYRIKEIIENK